MAELFVTVKVLNQFAWKDPQTDKTLAIVELQIENYESELMLLEALD